MFNEDKQQPLVLVVDDDIFMRGVLQNLLEEQGYRVSQAEDGVQALEAFQRCVPDLILLDAAMPVMDGFSACIKLKDLEKMMEVEVPVIMVTSFDDEYSVDKAFVAGAMEYITKPIHWAVLRHRVQIILQARQAQAALVASEARFRGIFEQAAMGIALVNMEGYVIQSNPALQNLLGYDEAALNGQVFQKLFYPFGTKVEKEFLQQLSVGTINHYQMEKYFFRRHSPMLWARLTVSLVRNTEGASQFTIEMVEDITERKRAQAKQRLTAKVFETTSDGVMITNAEGKIIDVNQAFLLMSGYNYEEVLDENPRFLKSGHHDRLFYIDMWEKARETGRWSGEIWNRHKSGEVYPTWLSVSAVRGEHNEITHYVAVYSDISLFKENDTRVQLLTHFDTLTELPNRLLFYEHLTRACRQEEKIALLYIDLDDFKHINETYGFDIGDEFLRTTAHRLKKCIREGDYISRLESDEFAIILTSIHQDYDVRIIVEKIFEAITKPVMLQGHKPQVDCNIGICFYPEVEETEQPTNVEILIQHADIAMYLAKEIGKNTYHIYQGLDSIE